jgi:hypothetical protein
MMIAWILMVVRLMLNNMKLTEKNYHSIKNRYLTGSRIGDFLKDKRRFYEKHITGTHKSEPTTAMLLGSAIDAAVTRSMVKFNKLFYTVDLRKKDAELQPGKIRLTASQYEDALNIATKLLSQSAIKELKKHKAQVILTHDVPLGNHFIGYGGMLDWLGFDDTGTVAYITDLKSGGKPTAREWHYKCLDFGYYRQGGLFSYLVLKNFPKVEKIVFRHIVVEKDNDDIYNCYTYIIDDFTIRTEINKILEVYAPAIANEKEFKANDAKWEEAVTVGYGIEF